MIWRSILAACLVAAVAAKVDAFTYRIVTVGSAIAAADMVVAATIWAAEPQTVTLGECGIKYVATVHEVFKGEPSGTIAFGERGPPGSLAVGGTYILFLSYLDSVGRTYNKAANDHGIPMSKPDVLKFIACNGLVPGFEFWEDMAWEIDGETIVIRYQLPPEDVPVEDRAPGLWVAHRQDVFAQLHALADREEGAGPR